MIKKPRRFREKASKEAVQYDTNYIHAGPHFILILYLLYSKVNDSNQNQDLVHFGKGDIFFYQEPSNGIATKASPAKI